MKLQYLMFGGPYLHSWNRQRYDFTKFFYRKFNSEQLSFEAFLNTGWPKSASNKNFEILLKNYFLLKNFL